MTHDILFKEQIIQETHFGSITLNRPQALNALTHDMIMAMTKQLKIWESDPNTQAIVIEGAGEKAFCAGGDILKIYEAKTDPSLKIKQFFWDEYRLNHLIHHYPKPYFSILNGITMGGGVGISLNAKPRIATEKFSFAMPETTIGFFPDVGGSFLLSRCPDETGVYLGLTGARIGAEDALTLGLVDKIISSEHIETFIEPCTEKPINTNLTLPREKIDAHFSHATIEEIFGSLERTNDTWCLKTLDVLKTKSPTSLKVTLEQIRRGKKLNFDECLKMEYRLTLNFLRHHDFYEGIRALLVDKDKKPQWQPNQLEKITDSMVKEYFTLPENEMELSL